MLEFLKAGHHRRHREEKTIMVWPRHKMPEERIAKLIRDLIPRERR